MFMEKGPKSRLWVRESETVDFDALPSVRRFFSPCFSFIIRGGVSFLLFLAVLLEATISDLKSPGCLQTEDTLESEQILDGYHVLIEFAQGDETWQRLGYEPVSDEAAARPSSGPVKSMVKPGCTGLVNMGNTCYFNSALQCLSNTRLLRDYFLSGDYRYDLNLGKSVDSVTDEGVVVVTFPSTEADMGAKGRLTVGFARLLTILWSGAHK